MHKDGKTTDHGRTRQKFAVLSDNPKPASALVTTKIGIMGRRTVAVPNIKRCRRITGFPLTGNASASSVFMLCGLSANATTPASRPLGRNVSGSAAAAALLISTPWHISLLWLCSGRRFFRLSLLPLTQTAPALRLIHHTHIPFRARFISVPGSLRLSDAPKRFLCRQAIPTVFLSACFAHLCRISKVYHTPVTETVTLHKFSFKRSRKTCTIFSAKFCTLFRIRTGR